MSGTRGGELLLLRHGGTAWSVSGRHTSWTDLPLTGAGEAEARAIAPLLAKRHVARVLVSPLLRARETARLAGAAEYEVEPDLHEWDYGGYEGVTTDEIHRTDPTWNLWTDGVAPGPPEHPGESPAQVGARADRVLDRIDLELSGAGEGDVLLIAHAHFLRVLTARRLGLEPAAGALFRLDTASLSRIGREHGRPVVTGWNILPGE